jgi:hypothetical protein
MTVIVGLLIGNETWELQERSIRSLRHLHRDQTVIIYYSLDDAESGILSTLERLEVETIDIGKPGLMGLFSAGTYSAFDTAEFNIKTSFKWLALLEAMKTRQDNAIFVDADIKITSPLPFAEFDKIWESYDVFVQDEGTNILPNHPCTGFMGFKFCEANLLLLQALHKEHCASIVSADGKHDQMIFYDYISTFRDVYRRIYFLPQMLFPVGYLGPIYAAFKHGAICSNGQVAPVIFHANWAVGIEAKAALMDSFHHLEISPDDQAGAGQLRLVHESFDRCKQQLRDLEAELGAVQADLQQGQNELVAQGASLERMQSDLVSAQSELVSAQSELENQRCEFSEVEVELCGLRQFEARARHSYKTLARLLWAETVNRCRRIIGS